MQDDKEFLGREPIKKLLFRLGGVRMLAENEKEVERCAESMNRFFSKESV